MKIKEISIKFDEKGQHTISVVIHNCLIIMTDRAART